MLFLMVIALVFSSFAHVDNHGFYKESNPIFGPITIPCNTDLPVPISLPEQDDLNVTSITTGICVLGCGVQDADNLIDVDQSNFASLTTAIGLGVTHTLTVSDNTVDEFYSAGGFAGFLIENNSVLQLDLLDAIVIRTYLDGIEQESESSNSLTAINSALLVGDQFYVGFYTTEDFDTVEISISSLAGVSTTTNVYHAVTNDFCLGPALECNTPTVLTKPDFPARIIDEHTGMGGLLGVGSVINADAAVDSDPNSYASIDFNLGVLATGSLSIKDELTDYSANTYAGFEIENSTILNLDLLNGITVLTYLDGVLQESKTGSSELLSVDSGLLFTGAERSQIGFVATLPFDEVQIAIQQTLSLDLGSTRIYGLVLEAFCEGSLECNIATVLSNPSQPVIINNQNSGVDGIACVGCEVDNATNVISEDNSDFATINVAAGVANTASISVENVLSVFPAGSHAGFVIRDTNDLLEIDLLNSIEITTYLDGVVQESQSGANLLALEALGLINITPSSTDGFYLLGFTTTSTYNEVKLSVNALLALVNSIEVYGSYVDSTIQIEGTVIDETSIGSSDGSITVTVSGGTPPYSYMWSPNGEITDTISGLSPGTYLVTVTDALSCEATSEFTVNTVGVQLPVPCNTIEPVAIVDSGFTDLTVSESTTGVCVIGCGITNEENIIDSDTDNYATVATLVGLGVTHTLTVTDETSDEFFTAGGYAGFLIENNAVVRADLLDAIVIRTYLDGVEQESNTSINLSTIESSVLTPDAYYVGFYTTMDYDAVEVSISSLLNVVSSTNVYHAVTNRFCEGPELSCNAPISVTKPEYPVRIVNERTGIDGLLSVGSVNNTNNLFDANLGNYATINLIAGVAATGSIAVKDEVAEYPAQTYAGFDIENATILNSQLLDAITISTYLDGVLVESQTGTSQLIPVNSRLLLTGTESVRVGFVTSAPFDEVQITLSQLVSLNLGSTRVYGMVLETFCARPIDCDSAYALDNPNDPVIINNNLTGINGIACVGCEVDNTQNLISGDNSDFALINITAGVAATASFSIKDVLSDYPAGTMAGYTIRDTNGLLEAELLSSITITTYLDDVQQEQQTASNLIALDALGIIEIIPSSTDSFYYIGFNTTVDFDEVQMTVASLAGVINTLEVYACCVDATNLDLCDDADIALVKTGAFNDENGDNCSDAGETITYTFTVTNEGNSSINSVELSDPLLGGVIALDSGDTDLDNELDTNETWIYTADYTILQSQIDAGEVINQATVTGISLEGNALSDLSDNDSVLEDENTVTTLCQRSDIALIKIGEFNDENGNGCSDVGETITYTFTVTNQGNTSINTIELSDPLLGGVITLGSGDTDLDNELDVDEIWIYTSDYAVNQTEIDAGIVLNQATVTGVSIEGAVISDLSDDDASFEDDTTETTLCQVADIALIKTAVFNDEDGDGCSSVGETITYTLSVSNEGNTTISSVEVVDSMLGGVLVLASGDTDLDNELDIDELWVYTADYSILQTDIDAELVVNQATVTAISSDGVVISDLSDNDSVTEDDTTDTVLCDNPGSMTFEKVGVFMDDNGDNMAEIGETIAYTYKIENIGLKPLFDVVVQDAIPGTLIVGDPIAVLMPGDIDTGSFTATYQLTQTDLDNMQVTNQSTVVAKNEDDEVVTDLSDDPFDLEDFDENNDGEPDDPTVTLLPDILDPDFEIFNGISPDGDSDNEFFKIVGIERYPNNNLKIYNRWGILVYEMDGYGINDKFFRGISEGRATIKKEEELPTGTYFYILRRFLDSETLTNNGYLYIKRK